MDIAKLPDTRPVGCMKVAVRHDAKVLDYLMSTITRCRVVRAAAVLTIKNGVGPGFAGVLHKSTGGITPIRKANFTGVT